MFIDSCASCNSRNNNIYQARDQQQLQNWQQTETWRMREEEWLRGQYLAFQPDPNRLVDVLV